MKISIKVRAITLASPVILVNSTVSNEHYGNGSALLSFIQSNFAKQSGVLNRNANGNGNVYMAESQHIAVGENSGQILGIYEQLYRIGTTAVR
jgi:hypothetical protein